MGYHSQKKKDDKAHPTSPSTPQKKNTTSRARAAGHEAAVGVVHGAVRGDQVLGLAAGAPRQDLQAGGHEDVVAA